MTTKKDNVIEAEIVETKKPKTTRGKTKEVAKVENKIINQDSAEMLITRAIDNNLPVETMERLLKMRKELKAEYAEEEFNKAMAKFQSECPEVQKTKAVKTKNGQVAYKYAPIEVIVRQVKGVMQLNGFSYRIQTKTENNLVKSICIVKHIAGHSEETELEVPLGNKTQVMSDSQVVAAASTFSKRYAFCNAFGILTSESDNDGRDMGSGQNYQKPVKPSTPAEIEQTIRDAIKFARKSGDAITLDERTQESDRFDAKFKKEIHNLASKKVEELDNG